jgi:hypothetical protein
MSGRITHGHTKGPAGSYRTSPEFRTWSAMKGRCLNPNNGKYHRYGARGIKVCDRWLGLDGFVNFLADMGDKPSASHSIDRFPNRNGNYEPGNCRWATSKQQGENRDKPTVNRHSHKTHCPSGHPYAAGNLRVTKTGRKCKECERLRAMIARRKKKEATNGAL